MPKAQPITVEKLYECDTHMNEAETPSEADFKTILSGQKGGNEEQKVTAMLIPRHYEKFPNLLKESLSAMKVLLKSTKDDVRLEVYRGLAQMHQSDSKAILKLLLAGLTDSEVSSSVSDIINRKLQSEAEFKNEFAALLPTEKPEIQTRMFEMISSQSFTEDTVSQLIELLTAALKSNNCIKDGLKLYEKNKKLLNEEQSKPIFDDLVNNLETAMNENLQKATSDILLMILPFTKTLGDERTKKILELIQNTVLPNFAKLETSTQISILQKLSDISHLVDDESMVTVLYNNAFLPLIPAEGEINSPLVESILWAFYKLAKKYPRVASESIGLLLVFTGQPGEGDDLDPNDEKKNKFNARLTNSSTVAAAEVEKIVEQIKQLKEAKEEKTEENPPDLRELKIQKRVYNNIQHFCRILQASNPLEANPPATPSWRPPAPKNKSKKGGRNDRRRSNDRRQDKRKSDTKFDRNSRRDDRRSHREDSRDDRYYERRRYDDDRRSSSRYDDRRRSSRYDDYDDRRSSSRYDDYDDRRERSRSYRHSSRR